MLNCSSSRAEEHEKASSRVIQSDKMERYERLSRRHIRAHPPSFLLLVSLRNQSKAKEKFVDTLQADETQFGTHRSSRRKNENRIEDSKFAYTPTRLSTLIWLIISIHRN